MIEHSQREPAHVAIDLRLIDLRLPDLRLIVLRWIALPLSVKIRTQRLEHRILILDELERLRGRVHGRGRRSQPARRFPQILDDHAHVARAGSTRPAPSRRRASARRHPRPHARRCGCPRLGPKEHFLSEIGIDALEQQNRAQFQRRASRARQARNGGRPHDRRGRRRQCAPRLDDRRRRRPRGWFGGRSSTGPTGPFDDETLDRLRDALGRRHFEARRPEQQPRAQHGELRVGRHRPEPEQPSRPRRSRPRPSEPRGEQPRGRRRGERRTVGSIEDSIAGATSAIPSGSRASRRSSANRRLRSRPGRIRRRPDRHSRPAPSATGRRTRLRPRRIGRRSVRHDAADAPDRQAAAMRRGTGDTGPAR